MNDGLETRTQQTNSLVVLCGEAAGGDPGEKGRDASASFRAECRYATRWPRPASVPLGEVRQLGAIAAARCTSHGCRRGVWNNLPSRPNEADTEHFSRSCPACGGPETGFGDAGKVAERLFQAYFVNGEDVGDPAVLLSIAREFGVWAISRVEDFYSRTWNEVR